MKKKTYTFKVGDRIGEFTSIYYPDEYSDPETVELFWDPWNKPRFGVVIEVSDANKSKGRIKVLWDDERCDGKPNEEFVSADKIAPEEVVKSRLLVLEKEFAVVEQEVMAKMKEVAKGIRDANKLAKKAGRPLAQLHKVYYGTLYKAMDDAGWRTSSFGC